LEERRRSENGRNGKAQNLLWDWRRMAWRWRVAKTNSKHNFPNINLLMEMGGNWVEKAKQIGDGCGLVG
jgi:hypothetical protein